MIGIIGSLFGVPVIEADEGTMRDLLRQAGENEDEWETMVVFLDRQTFRLSGGASGSLFEKGRIANEARCSAAAMRRLRDAIPDGGARDSTECK